ncbi:hypothetical protein DACRYDRAFT_109261 [Dacryopinax primogenitus]|uniref:F-box domain-containing protein n=1 Tax=Dacryopinax primogenitus (strain DJM 731) TaxID=1858805 RepID=M5G7T3_DACPD|nr:uncharacterized protein DACRYDRAFT_109261 [Dacryopinax primogenitus]EJT99837.1 hypothetical protein DACRYDRAFT_109261 [Dacryopinax primogenitus]
MPVMSTHISRAARAQSLVFNCPELAEGILRFMDRNSILQLMLAGRQFWEPCAYQLWHTLDSFDPPMRLLPSDLWLWTILGFIDELGVTRPLLDEDVARWKLYAGFVRMWPKARILGSRCSEVRGLLWMIRKVDLMRKLVD